MRYQLVSLWPEEGVTATNCLHTADQQVKMKEKAVAMDPEGILGNISMALLLEVRPWKMLIFRVVFPPNFSKPFLIGSFRRRDVNPPVSQNVPSA